jgi:flagellar protein FliS
VTQQNAPSPQANVLGGAYVNATVAPSPLSVTQRAARNRYVENTVSTVPPQTLLVMLYDRLIKDCDTSRTAISEKNYYEANRALQHAQDILVELHAALDPTKWDDAPKLGSLYVYLIGELTEANLKKDIKKVVRVRSMLVPLRDAWVEAAAIVTGTGQAPVTVDDGRPSTMGGLS